MKTQLIVLKCLFQLQHYSLYTRKLKWTTVLLLYNLSPYISSVNVANKQTEKGISKIVVQGVHLYFLTYLDTFKKR